MNLKLSAPKETTWIIAVIAGALGILTNYGVFSIGGLDAFLLVMIGFVILAIATMVKGL
ncbi:MAG TPA: hypothetical protein VF982_11650 [Anaerolineales bacterium]|jgi:hypothetical protein